MSHLLRKVYKKTVNTCLLLAKDGICGMMFLTQQRRNFHMNHMFRITAAGLALTAALTASAFAADFTASADHLKELGLFRGTDQGYELDRAPTRAEAAAMLVRLLGKEEEAQKLAYDAPFTDLQSWEKPYVQYLYQNGLTTGATATAFEPDEACTAQMYGAFVLRALGYTETAGDFTYEKAVDFAKKNGVYDSMTVNPAHFLRDHVVAASYTALALSPKGEEGTLLDALVQDGAVSSDAAAASDKLMQVYNQYRKATVGMDALQRLAVQHELTLTTKNMTMKSSETTRLDLAAPALLTNRVITLSAEGIEDKTLSAESYVANGVQYLKQNGQKTRKQLTDAELGQLTEGFARVPLALIDHMTVSGSTYTITYNTAGLNRLGTALDAAASAVGSLEDAVFSGLTVQQTASNGRIAAQELRMQFDADGLTGSLTSSMKLTGVDGQVTMTAPADLDSYALIS